MRHRSGFILIIVLAVLGILAYLALSLVEQSRLARILSRAYILECQTKLVARSGIEKGKQWILKPFLDGGSPSQAEPMARVILPVSVPLDGQLSASVRVDDSSGRICINDGMKAGQAELKNLYNPQALDPWPEPPSGQAISQQDVSAWINIRLRSLLNAYGDVQRFAAFQLPNSIPTKGWPTWNDAGGNGTNPEPTYGVNGAFEHSATDTGNRFDSIPPCWFDGTARPPATSAGLGDRIIGARPAKGYTDVEQIRDILNQWWADTKPSGNAEVDFFWRVSSDFTAVAWHDPAFWRMKREFGVNHGVFTDQAVYQNDATHPYSGATLNIETSPPDFTDIWKPHPVPPININSASDAVRAAVFHAPVNVSLPCEVQVFSTIRWVSPFNYNAGGGGPSFLSSCPGLEARIPPVRAVDLMENGYLLNAGSFLTKLQRNRLLSVRDAMICAQAYRAVAEDPLVGWPDSFERLARHFRYFLINGGNLGAYQVRLIERGKKPTSPFLLGMQTYGKVSDFDEGSGIADLGNPGAPNGGITQWVMSEMFFHIFSCQRRLPSWMGAPVALISPWRRHTYNGERTTDVRTVEDFVFRSPLPKVTFQPTGVFLLESNAASERGPMKCRRRILAVVQAYEQTVLRDQDSFRAVKDPATSNDIQIGPELGATISSPYLGTVGLKDRGEVVPGGTMLNDPGVPVLGTRHDFVGGFGKSAVAPLSNSVRLANGTADPDNNPGTHHIGPGDEHQELKGSALEGPAVSIFPKAGTDACDLSPFGGMFLSSFNSGTRSLTPFGDAFYFRPDIFLTPVGSSSYTGTKGNSGLISLWYRKPSGVGNGYCTLMHLVLWERVRVRLATPPGATEERLRPIYFHLRTSQKHSLFSVASGNFGLTGNGEPGAPADSGYYFQPWPQLTAMPLPTSAADYSANPVFKSMMPPWTQGAPANYWSGDMLTHTYGYAFDAYSFRANLSGPSTSPYSQRPGGWVRVVARWDFGKIAPNENKIELISHHLGGINHDNSNSSSTISNLNFFNPKMVMSFGEVHYQVRPASIGSDILPPANPLGSLLPLGRLNSCIDNIVFQFGGFPNADFETDPTTPAAETKMYNAVQAIPGFNNRRYNILPASLGLMEPVWVINPKLPSGSKILQFGARIYDVPFYPYFDSMTGAKYRKWDVKAPRVDLSFTDTAPGNVRTPTRSALPIWDQGKNIHSSAWSSYPIRDSKDARFRLTYRSVDAMDQPLDEDVLSDIPWIQEVNWAWIPPTGMRFLSWKEE